MTCLPPGGPLQVGLQSDVGHRPTTPNSRIYAGGSFRTPVPRRGSIATALPGARGPFLACPRKGPKRRTPHSLALRAFEAGLLSDLEASRPTAVSGPARRDIVSRRASERRPCRSDPGQPPAVRQPVRGREPSFAAVYTGRRGFLPPKLQDMRSARKAHNNANRRESPLTPCLASGESQGLAGRDAGQRFAATGRRVEPTRPRLPVREADRAAIRPAGPRRRGVLLFVGFLGQARKPTRAPGSAANQCQLAQPARETVPPRFEARNEHTLLRDQF